MKQFSVDVTQRVESVYMSGEWVLKLRDLPIGRMRLKGDGTYTMALAEGYYFENERILKSVTIRERAGQSIHLS
ncbi:MAG: DUF2553 family protein [Bacilli bacterium]